MFLERAPKDPPPPRRSKRSGPDEEPETSPQPAKKLAARKSESPSANEDDIRLHEVEPKLDLATKEEETVTGSNEKQGPVKKRQRVVRNVGGWVSPEFAEEIDRSWLARDSPPDHFDLSTYSPQIGDTVL